MGEREREKEWKANANTFDIGLYDDVSLVCGLGRRCDQTKKVILHVRVSFGKPAKNTKTNLVQVLPIKK